MEPRLPFLPFHIGARVVVALGLAVLVTFWLHHDEERKYRERPKKMSRPEYVRDYENYLKREEKKPDSIWFDGAVVIVCVLLFLGVTELTGFGLAQLPYRLALRHRPSGTPSPAGTEKTGPPGPLPRTVPVDPARRGPVETPAAARALRTRQRRHL